MLKKYFAVLVVLTTVLMAFSGCSNEKPEEIPEESVKWDRNLTEHWVNGENGEKENLGEHKLDEIGICDVCGSEIIDFGDGFLEIYNYDEQGNLARLSAYSSDGQCIDDSENVFEYDESGNIIHLKVYQNGFFCGESEFSYSSEGWTYESRTTTYYSDGSYSAEEYNENGNGILFQSFDADGNLVTESINDFENHSDGFEYLAKTTSKDYSTGFEYIYHYNEHNDLTYIAEYDGSKNLIYDESHEYGYDEEGRRSYMRS